MIMSCACQGQLLINETTIGMTNTIKYIRRKQGKNGYCITHQTLCACFAQAKLLMVNICDFSEHKKKINQLLSPVQRYGRMVMIIIVREMDIF